MLGTKLIPSTTLAFLFLAGAVASSDAATFMVDSSFSYGANQDASGMYVGLYGGQAQPNAPTGLFGMFAAGNAALTADGDYTSTAYTSLYRAWWSPKFNPVTVSDSFSFDYEVVLRDNNQVVASHTFEWTVELSPGPTAQDNSNVTIQLGDTDFDFSYLGENYTYAFWGLNNSSDIDYGNLNTKDRITDFNYDDITGDDYWRHVRGSGTCVLAGIQSGGEVDPVPEPASLLLLGTGIVTFFVRRRRSV